MLKDHKENFQTKRTYRHINPTKSEPAEIGKIILEGINTEQSQEWTLGLTQGINRLVP